MSEVKWIKLSTDIFDNRKIRQIEKMPDGDAIIVIWLKLLILAGDINDNGLVYFTKEIPYTDQLLATHFDRPIAVVQFALRTFEQFNMIEIVDNLIHVSNWEKYQNVDGLDRIREQNRLRQKRWYDNQKALPEPNVRSNVSLTEPNGTDIELDKDKEVEVESNKRFKPPNLDEVAAYCKERNNGINAEAFIDYYAARNWMLGKVKMKDWKAAVRTWERNGYSCDQKKPEKKKPYAASCKEAPKVDINELKNFLETI